MDLSESTTLLLHRIREIEPNIASKAIGYLLLTDNGDREIIRLAYGPDYAISALIKEVKSALPLMKMPSISVAPDTAADDFRLLHRQALSPSTNPGTAALLQTQSPFWDTETVSPVPYTPRSTLDPPAPYSNCHLLLNPDDLNTYYNDYTSDATIVGPRTTRRSSYFPESPPSLAMKACHYYHRGYCKHGDNCRFLHDQPTWEGFTYGYALSSDVTSNDDHEFVPGSLEKLETEITELLRSKNGQPISIAMLPMLYQDKYGKTLQADGYLTESQRHGKAGYNLTKLLARMKGSIRLIDRPHGQHSVILAEDAPTGFEYRSERNDSGNSVPGCQQIYLTFPAESTFSEDDIANYFSQFGPVQAVRIPIQQKRMFGFVTFVHPEAVPLVFAKGNPHYICNARVLVKPYREKTRKSCDKIEIPICYHSRHNDLSRELQPVPNVILDRIPRKQLEQDHLFEVQRRMTQLQLNAQPYTLYPYMGYNLESMRYQEEPKLIQTAEDFSSRFTDVIEGSVDEKFVDTDGVCCDKTSQIELPDSPFASQ